MTRYEYKVLTPPAKGVKAPGRKTAEARHANAVELFLNEQASAGWEYLRSDILPNIERQGLTSSQTVYRTVMVFRRPVEDAAEMVIAEAQAVAEAPAPVAPETAPVAEPPSRDMPEPAETDPAPDADPGHEPDDAPRKP
ncbi:MAG: hypothetical protein R3210_06175 [Roseovarius sp.]|nr:hypothetical protein [Roseovarius sp.]